MSRRRISSTRRRSHRRSSSGPGELLEDSDVFNTDDPLWYKRMEGNNTILRPSLQLSNAGESSAVLDSESDPEMGQMNPPTADWTKRLEKFNQTLQKTSDVARPSINSRPSSEDSIPNEDSLNSEPEKKLRKRKKLLYGSYTRESLSLGGSAYLNALNDSATTVISDPGPSKRRKSDPKSSFLSDEDSFKRPTNLRLSGLNKRDDETCHFSPSKMRKSRPPLFMKIQQSHAESSENIFKNVLDNVSSSTDSSSIVAADKNQHLAQSSDKTRNSVLENIEEIKPSQEPNPTLSQTRKYKDSEQDPDENHSQQQRTTGSHSKAADTSISSNSKVKASLSEEQKGNSTTESNSDIEMQKKRPNLFTRKRQSIAVNAFENVFTSEDESTLNKSLGRNSSAKSLQGEKERELEKQNKKNSNESKNNSRLTPILEATNLGSRLGVKEDDSQSESEIDVEYKNDEGAKSSKEDSLKSTSSRKKKSVVSENRSKLTVNSMFDSNSEEEEELISIGSQRIDDHSNLDISKNHNSGLHKSKATLQNVDSSRRSSRLNKSANDFEEQSTSDRLSILKKKQSTRYESTRKIDVQKSKKHMRKTKSRGDSKLSNAEGNEDYSEDLMENKTPSEELTEGLTARKSVTLNAPSKRNSNQEEESDSDIEVSDPKVDNDSKNKSNISNLEERNNESASNHEKQSNTIQLSILSEKPQQYESTRKVDVQIYRKSLKKIESRDLNKSKSEELTTEKSATVNLSKNVSSRRNFNEEEESDLDIEVSDPKVDNSSKNKSKTSNLEEGNRESELNRSQSNNNMGEISEQSSENIVNSPNQSSQKERSGNSERSQTISLSEGQSIENEMLGDKSSSVKATSKSNDQRTKRSYQNIIASASGDEKPLQEDNLLKKQPAKPKITNYEILKLNDIDLRKLKTNKKVIRTEDDVENNLNSEESNTSRISNSSAIRDIPASKSFKEPETSTKGTRMSTVEEEFSRLHGGDSETLSTSQGHFQSTRNLFPQDVSDKKSKEDSKNKTSNSDLPKTLEDEDKESDISENPLLTYQDNLGEEESDYEGKNSSQDWQLEKPSSTKTDMREGQQTTIDDFFKSKGRKISEKKHLPVDPSKGIPSWKIAESKQKVAVMTAKIREELFGSKAQEQPKEKILFVKRDTGKKKKDPKSVDPAYMVNGVIYKRPRLPRPQKWATDHLYKYIWKKIEPKYKLATRVRSEKFVTRLGEVVKKVTVSKSYKKYKDDLEDLMKEMAHMGIIVHRKDFNDFCVEFLPITFREKATPFLLPGNKMWIEYDPDKLFTSLI